MCPEDRKADNNKTMTTASECLCRICFIRASYLHRVRKNTPPP